VTVVIRAGIFIITDHHIRPHTRTTVARIYLGAHVVVVTIATLVYRNKEALPGAGLTLGLLAHRVLGIVTDHHRAKVQHAYPATRERVRCIAFESAVAQVAIFLVSAILRQLAFTNVGPPYAHPLRTIVVNRARLLILAQTAHGRKFASYPRRTGVFRAGIVVGAGLLPQPGQALSSSTCVTQRTRVFVVARVVVVGVDAAPFHLWLTDLVRARVAIVTILLNPIAFTELTGINLSAVVLVIARLDIVDVHTTQLRVAGIIRAHTAVVTVCGRFAGRASAIVTGVAQSAQVVVRARDAVEDVNASEQGVTRIVGAQIGIVAFQQARARLAFAGLAIVIDRTLVPVLAGTRCWAVNASSLWRTLILGAWVAVVAGLRLRTGLAYTVNTHVWRCAQVPVLASTVRGDVLATLMAVTRVSGTRAVVVTIQLACPGHALPAHATVAEGTNIGIRAR
jgi:hypothetical protein